MLQFAKGDKKKINRCHLHEDEVIASTSTSERHIKITRKESTPSPDPLMFAIFESFQSKLKKKKTNMHTFVGIRLKTLLKKKCYNVTYDFYVIIFLKI